MSDAYAAARIHSMHSRIIKPEEYERLMRMSEREVIAYLQSSEYKQDVDELKLIDLDDLETVDRIMARNNDRVITKLRGFCNGKFRAALDRELAENDMWNIKVIAESIVGGLDPTEELKLYGRQGTIDTERMRSAKSMQELATTLTRRYPHIISELGREMTPAELIEEINAKPGAGIVGLRRIDLAGQYLLDEQNIIKLIMFKRDNLPSGEIRRRMRRGGTVPRSVLFAAADAPSVEAALRILRSTRYSTIIDMAIANPGGSFVRFEYALRHDILRRIRRLSGRYPLGPEMLQRYLVEKEIEMGNVRLIIKAKRLGLGEGFIRDQLLQWT